MERFTLAAGDGATIHVCRWLPEDAPRAVVHISHGMSEYAARYDRLARALTAAGYAVYAHDHRGHGEHAQQLGHYGDVDGWECVIDDLHRVQQHIAAQHPGVPRVLLGHSMGSFIARSYFVRHGDGLAGLVLSATGYRQKPLAHLLRTVARRVGRGRMDQPSRCMAVLVFGTFNLGFFPARTQGDWLSRDPAEVDAYLNDPLCGYDVSAGLWVDLFGAIVDMEKAEGGGQVAGRCPVMILAGSRDPVSMGKLACNQLARRYRAAGVADVDVRVYPGGRHEMFNESNRDEVTADLVAWLRRVVG